MTSLFVTIQTIGGMLGPFIGAPLLAGTSNPFGLRDNYHGEPGGKSSLTESGGTRLPKSGSTFRKLTQHCSQRSGCQVISALRFRRCASACWWWRRS